MGYDREQKGKKFQVCTAEKQKARPPCCFLLKANTKRPQLGPTPGKLGSTALVAAGPYPGKATRFLIVGEKKRRISITTAE